MAKRKTNSRRRRAPRPKRRGGVSDWAKIVVTAVVFGLAGWLAYDYNDSRHWRAFNDSGDSAYRRGNYNYAERMYIQALQEGIRLDPRGSEVAETLADLSRTYQDQNRPDMASRAIDQLRQLRSSP
ncbi:MAG: tetratricopeptide repeat protein [Candidatus Latescibacterota bacterium]|nr:tetratricopeptide repeat protein [Candidatus Latescibacterota bacterium]